jgi:5-formyltetrahydrofolate cyclo-ligase
MRLGGPHLNLRFRAMGRYGTGGGRLLISPVITEPATQQLRRVLRAQRKALDAHRQAEAAERLKRLLLTLPVFRSSRRVACYLPNDGEIDPTPLIVQLWAAGRRCYLPVLSRLSRDRLWFARYLPDTRLVDNRFGIPEPDVPPRTWVRAHELDLVLMPLVGFDLDGNRLGMGGGFYDRSLDFLRRRRHWRRPRLIGLAHDFQRVDRLLPAPWDVPMQYVVTDRAIYPVARAGRR